MKITCEYKENLYWPPLTESDFENICPKGYKIKEVNDYGNGTYDITIKKRDYRKELKKIDKKIYKVRRDIVESLNESK